MALPKIMKPLVIVVGIIAVGSFFIANNLLPYTNKKMLSTLYDIRQQQQTLEFQDGLFFNGIDGMSIRVGHQDSHTGLLTDVLIYDNREKNTNNMRTIVADSGYIRLTDDKRYLNVTLFHGQNYQQTRNIQWYSNSTLEHHIFDKQDMFVPIEGFDMQRSDAEPRPARTGHRLAGADRRFDHHALLRAPAPRPDLLERPFGAAARHPLRP